MTDVVTTMGSNAPDLSPLALRTLFGSYPSGVTAVCALVDGAPVGIAASSFTSVSIDPPLVSVCMALSSSTWPRLRPVDTIGISVLSAEHDQLCRQLAGRDGDRFAGVDWRAAPSGAVAIAGAAAFLECSVESEVTAGDHVIVVLRIVDWDHAPSVAPLVFHASGFRQLQPSAAEAEGA